MFIGHYAIAFAAKKASPTTSLGTLFIAANLADLLFPIFLLFGWEEARIEPGATALTSMDLYHYPFSHGLLALLLWSAFFGRMMHLRYRNGRASLTVMGLVISHWVLDVIAHRPDMPITTSEGPRIGLGLWNSFAGTFLVEGGFMLAGVWIYLKRTRSLNSNGSYGLASLVLVLVGIYVASLFRPPPESMETVITSGFLQWIFVIWAFVIDRNRRLKDVL